VYRLHPNETNMNTELYRLVYCSRNRIRGTEAEVTSEIQQILRSSRDNNARVGVTGALLYDAGTFAQALEGPLAAVEEVFERIQEDFRHSDVTVVENGPVATRLFGDWAMAMCGDGPKKATLETSAVLEAAFAHSSEAGGQVLELLGDLVMQENDRVLVDAW